MFEPAQRPLGALTEDGRLRFPLSPHETTPMAVSDVTDSKLQVVQALREMAALLEAQKADPYRAAAYRNAADTVSRMPEEPAALFKRGGLAGLDALPGIGPRIAAAIAEMLSTGRWRQLEQVRGDADPVSLLRTVPGVGPGLAQRLHESLGIGTLEALEVAARCGRLERLPGLGPRRAAAIRAAVGDILNRRRSLQHGAATLPAGPEPPVGVLLDVDAAYRRGARAGELPTISPRRLNPEGRAWLPVLHTQRGEWHFTALYSNTARAHELGRVHDWVVLYAEHPLHGERHYTVVTALRGALAGQRVVRGREAESRVWLKPGVAA